MQPFRFRLQRILEYRVRCCDAERARVMQCHADLRATRESLAALQAESVQAERQIMGRTRLEAQDLAALERYRLRLKKREMGLRQMLDRQQTALEAQLQALSLARRKEKSLEMLRQHRLDEHVYQENRGLEELASDAFLSKR